MIWPFDPRRAGQDLLAHVYRLRRDAHLEVAPDEPFESEAEVVSTLRHPGRRQPAWHWAAGTAPRAAGTAGASAAAPIVGYAELRTGEQSSTGFARIVVSAGHRRRGIGRRLLDQVTRRAADAGCTVLNGTFAVCDAYRFCLAAGARLGLSYVRMAVHLPTATPAVRPVPGYRLHCWTATTPAPLLQSYARARNAIRHAPVDDGVVLPAWTAQRVRDEEAASAVRGVYSHVTVALADDGEVAAFTGVRLPRGPGATASTEDTAVLPQHRGRGLAQAVKAESLRLLAAARPDVTWVTTTNAESNPAILAVNRRLGFRPTSVWRGAVLPL